jgi:hypothetical protein
MQVDAAREYRDEAYPRPTQAGLKKLQLLATPAIIFVGSVTNCDRLSIRDLSGT